ncbi:ATP-binding cassette domain-containing protein [Microbacterium bovistercoris]|uniref:ATP-binding cassette domain-containing protein n=1 Tax=Microbacterium bovistercoris TaxID=2293570 RepID=A0A371NV34_9MICO|nr:ATP-binding cassette domain-containing protein [Microbacterium bovistercoris]REJ06378.1 ATP-binding cassette domain-containing protein [Microbacterium bovistercoris]
MRVEVQGLGHRYGDNPWLFRELSAAFLPERTYALTGPSGSGKSTLLSIIAGWEAPDEGAVNLEGIKKVNWVFQSPHGMPQRSALDHVAHPYLVSGMTVRDAEVAAMSLLVSFQLAHTAERAFSSLSGGEAQRLMLARGVAADPQLLLVDEPTAQLDHATARQINDIIGQLAAGGRIVLIATHDASTRDACTDHLDLTQFAFAAERS